MALWIIAALALVAAWAAYLLFALPTWVPVVVTLAVAAGVGGALAWRRYRAKAAARALERELMKQAELQAAGARPDRRVEIAELQAQLRRGIDTLKATKLGGQGGEQALYALPWYVIVGPPGAGKTTALVHSGLEFPIEAAGGRLRGVGGTRNCDWIFTNDAILLDTAGRYATQDDDRDEWLAFLDLLRRHRPRSPINGIVVAVSLADLAAATEEQAEAMGKTLRARVDEIMTRLRMVVPVYVMFTKTDLVAGFVEFWEDLKKSERAQVWGATLPLYVPFDVDLGELFGREFDGLVEALHGVALRRIGALPRAESRARAMMFPLEMRSLRAPLAEFVRALFRRNRYQDTPIFRGFYFTSGIQEGRPLDRLLGGMAQAFGMRLPSAADGPAVEPKSYFLTDLFRRVMFPDQHVAGRTSAEAQRQMLTRFGALAAGALLALLVAAPSAVSFVRNWALAADVQAAGDEAHQADWSRPDALRADLARLQPLHERLAGLEAWRRDGRPSSYGWGFYAGERLEASAGRAFGGTLRARFALPTAVELERRLRSIEPFVGGGAGDRYGAAYDQLKAYLMLTEVEHLDVDWATPPLARAWAEQKGQAALAADPRLLEQVRHHLELVKRGVVEPAPRNEQAVAYARSALLHTPPIDRLYEGMVREANAKIAPIRHEMIFYGNVAAYVRPKRNDVVVRGAYTKLGWQMVRGVLEGAHTEMIAESWVLGTDERLPDAAITKQIEQIRRQYFERYRNAWADFLLNVDVQRPANAGRSLDELLALAEPEWPYLRLLRTLHENVTLDMGALKGDDPAVDPSLFEKMSEEARRRLKLAPGAQGAKPDQPERAVSPVERAFQPLTAFAVAPDGAKAGDAPTGLVQYMGATRKLVGALTDLNDSNSPDLKSVVDEYQTAFRSTSALLADQDGYTRPMLSPLLLRPITASWASIVNDAGGAAGGLWELEVWRPWSDKLEPLYPFRDASMTDASVEDFAEFFRPQGGTLWGFYDHNLKGSLEPRGDSFVPSRRFGASAPFGGKLVNCLRASRHVAQAMFADEAKTPHVAFEVNLHSVSPDVAEVTIAIDGTTHTYRNTPEEWLSAQWPAKNPKERGASVLVRGFSGLKEELSRPGDFGLFRLLEAAELQPVSGASRRGKAQAFIATWKLRSLPGATVKMEFRPSKAEHPFSRAFFSDVRCPRLITN